MPEGEPGPGPENAPKSKSAQPEATPQPASEIHIATPKDIEQTQEERRQTYREVMDTMERQTERDGFFFARFGVKESEFRGVDRRALILTEPIVTESVRRGPLWKTTTTEQRMYIVMTEDGPKTITFEGELKPTEEALRKGIESRVATCVENSIQLTDIHPGERVMTTRELSEKAERRLRAENVLQALKLMQDRRPTSSTEEESTERVKLSPLSRPFLNDQEMLFVTSSAK